MGRGPSEARYEVLCAWCLREGRHTVVGYSSVANSHSICAEHAQVMVEEQHAAAMREQRSRNERGKPHGGEK